jgi:hypothetical protein
MKKIALILGIFLLQSCGKTENKSVRTTLDTSQYAIIKLDSSKHEKQFEISINDINEVEKLLADCIKGYNPKQLKRFNQIVKENPGDKIDKNHFIIDLSRYKRQYVGVINEKGEKEISVYCFCGDGYGNWRKEVLLVMDGGNCFFGLRINLTTKKYYNFQVNGSA